MTKFEQEILLIKVREISDSYTDQKMSHDEVFAEIWGIAENGIAGNLYSWVMPYAMGIKKGDQVDNLFVLLLLFLAATNESEQG